MYFDYFSSSPLWPNIIQEIPNLLSVFGNPSSMHQKGRAARTIIEQTRHIIANDLNFPSQNIIFTSSASEANAMILHSFPGTIITSSVEHASVLENSPHALRVRVNTHGLLDLCMLEDFLKHISPPVLVSVMAVNNETGIIMPIEDIVRLAHHYEALVHVDFVQGYRRIKYDDCLDPDFLTLSGHKIGALKGVGALAFRDKKYLSPLFLGGGQEYSLRSGTENVLAIATFGLAAKNDYPVLRIKKQQQRLEEELKYLIPNITIVGEQVDRVPGCTNIIVPDVSSEFQVIALDQADICVGSGSACSSGRIKRSHVLDAMGLEHDSDCSIRISIGHNTQDSDIDIFLERYKIIIVKGCSVL